MRRTATTQWVPNSQPRGQICGHQRSHNHRSGPVSAGMALAYSALPALIMHAVPVSETAAANGLNTLMRTIGQAVCSAVVVTVLTTLVATHAGGGVAPRLGAYQVT